MYVSSINDLGNHVDRHIDLWVHNVTFLKEEFLFDTNRNSFLEFYEHLLLLLLSIADILTYFMYITSCPTFLIKWWPSQRFLKYFTLERNVLHWGCERVRRLAQIFAHALVGNSQQLAVRADVVVHVADVMTVLVLLASPVPLLAPASNIRE